MPRALVVDDSRAMRAVLAHILRDLGCEVHEAGHGREALERLDQLGPVDVALVDWNMPEMNGLDFVRAVRACPRHSSLQLVMVTTESDALRMTRALEAGADEYVMKPFTPQSLREKLALLGLP